MVEDACITPTTRLAGNPGRRRRLPPPTAAGTHPRPARPCRRVRASEVCRAWRDATLSPALWPALKFSLASDDDEATTESFLCWLLPRVGCLQALHIDIQEVNAVRAAPVLLYLYCWPGVGTGAPAARPAFYCCPVLLPAAPPAPSRPTLRAAPGAAGPRL